MKMEFFPSTLPVQAPCVLNTVILCCCCHHCCCCWCHHCCCCWCHHCCCCCWCHHCCCCGVMTITAVVGGVIIAVVAFTAAGADVAETHKVVSSQYISEAVCLTESLRGEDGHTTGTKVASEYRQVQLVCADLFRLTAPFLLAVNACHNGQPWLKGEQQTSWLTGHLLIL